MKLRTAVTLGRVSNLPTVWTNVMAAVVLAGADLDLASLGMVLACASLLYVAGMYLNDAFDAQIDARERPERPIPSGEVTRETVLRWGFAMLAGAVGLMLARALTVPAAGWGGVFATVVTATLIVVYDRWHKGNPLGPILMGGCRLGVYAIAAWTTSDDPPMRVWLGGSLLLGYVLGLTWVAKYENASRLARTWPLLFLFAPALWSVPALRGDPLLRLVLIGFVLWVLRALDLIRGGATKQAVGSLIAGIALVDALVIARYGTISMTVAAVGAFGLTLALQRRVAGT